MEVLETREQAAERERADREEREVVREVSRVLREAQDDIDRERSEKSAGDDSGEGLSAKMEANVSNHVESSPVLGKIAGRTDPVAVSKADARASTRVVSVTDAEKSAFVDSVVSGGRYFSEERLLGGRLVVRFRSRSAAESEAIDSFLRKRVAMGLVRSNQEYADAMRFCVLAAGVDELNGEKFKTLSEAGGGTGVGMFYTESKDGLEEPRWMWLYDLWRGKPESIVAIVIESYFDFEAKYWLMISRSGDENFWSPGESTGR